MGTRIYFCRICKSNVLEDAWNAHKLRCNACADRRSKYNARKTELDGVTFDSQKEANRYSLLKNRLQAGEISNLELQPRFPIIVNGKTVAHYVADFRYVDLSTQQTTVEDAKGFKTPTYQLKKKLVEALYPITIIEV